MRFTSEERMHKYNAIKQYLYDSEEFSNDQKDALRKLFDYLENETEWLTAYCSTRFHNSYEGGLIDHSINVSNAILKIKRALYPNLSEPELVLIGLLHDCGKYNSYKRKEPTERQRQYGYPGSMSTNNDVPYMGHEDRSLWIITKFYPYLTEEMFTAIALHNEPWLTNTCQFKNCPMATCLQTADYHCCLYVDEPGESY